jgi:hypothetical protein
MTTRWDCDYIYQSTFLLFQQNVWKEISPQNLIATTVSSMCSFLCSVLWTIVSNFVLWPKHCLSFSLRLLINLTAYSHCYVIVCPSAYDFWLTLQHSEYAVRLIRRRKLKDRKCLGQRTKLLTIVHKTLHRKLHIEQHEPHYKPGTNSDDPLR